MYAHNNNQKICSADTLDNLLSVKEDDNLIQYVYDTNANIRLEYQGDKKVSYAYEHNGDKRFIGYEGMHFSLLRNKSGHIECIAQGGNTYTFGFNTKGEQVSLAYPNRIESKSVFDTLGRLTNRSLSETPLLAYTYDKSSRIVMRNDTTYNYSQSGELLIAGDTVYEYDESGNPINPNAPQCTYNTLGQLTQKQTHEFVTTYEYDMHGRLVMYSKISTFPVRTELVKVQLQFTYDPLGRRLTKYYQDEVQEYHHRYLYAGDNIVAIYDNDTDRLLATLLHEEDRIDSPLSIHVHPQETMTLQEQQHFENLDEAQQYLLAQSRIKRYYYHRDHQNSIIALSDANAQIVEYYEYDAYGNITQAQTMKDEKDNTIQTLNPYRYTGREFDTDDLYYYRARYYDPILGRFITPDPIGFMGGDMNLYRYVGNDPVNFVDWSGFAGISNHGTQNPSQEALTKSVPKTTVPNPKPTNGGKSASPTGKDGCKVSGEAPKPSPYIPHAVVFFIGGAGDQEGYYGAGPYGNIEEPFHAFENNKNIFDPKLGSKIQSILFGYYNVKGYFDSQKILNKIKLLDDIDRTFGKRTLIYIIGHSLGGWNGAHLAEELSKYGYATEILITLDPVGKGILVATFSDISYAEPKPKAKKWINIRCNPKNQDFSDYIALAGERWIPKSTIQTINVVVDINHKNANALFNVKLGDTGKSSLDNLIESLREKIK